MQSSLVKASACWVLFAGLESLWLHTQRPPAYTPSYNHVPSCVTSFVSTTLSGSSGEAVWLVLSPSECCCRVERGWSARFKLSCSLSQQRERECRSGPRRAASVLFSLPSIFKCTQTYLSSRPAANVFERPVSSNVGMLPLELCSRQMSPKERRHFTEGIVSLSPSASDALKDQCERPLRGEAVSLVNKQHMLKNVQHTCSGVKRIR